MAFSSVVRGATHVIARAPILFFRQTSRIHHFAPRRPLLTGAVLHRGGEINLPYSFSPLAPFSSLISNKQSSDAELLRIIKSEIESAAEELREIQGSSSLSKKVLLPKKASTIDPTRQVPKKYNEMDKDEIVLTTMGKRAKNNLVSSIDYSTFQNLVHCQTAKEM
ncbi:hypothetical protein KSP39_PZI009527 [Platanthera zijinensis]|uniref:Uncharacterized protein n=1 Tax=Platanthera zijinensis TaxID=2320716 RepID=A0AAP0BJM0_9ASPA